MDEKYIEKNGERYVFSEIAVDKGNISAEANLTPDEIIHIANNIWEYISDSKYDQDDRKSCENVMANLCAEHQSYRQFHETFPYIMNSMINRRLYRKNVLRKHLEVYMKSIPTTMEERCKMHINYEYELALATTHRLTQTQRVQIRKVITETLEEEYKNFTEASTEAKQKMDEIKEQTKSKILEMARAKIAAKNVTNLNQ